MNLATKALYNLDPKFKLRLQPPCKLELKPLFRLKQLQKPCLGWEHQFKPALLHRIKISLMHFKRLLINSR